MKTEKQQSVAAAAFAKKWEGRGYEKGESQIFWTELLTEVMGVEDPSQFIQFEQQALLDHTSFIDGMIPSTHVMIDRTEVVGQRLAPGHPAERRLFVDPLPAGAAIQCGSALLAAPSLDSDLQLRRVRRL